MYFKSNFLPIIAVLEEFRSSANEMEAATTKDFQQKLNQFDVTFVLQFL